jgi:membrane-associated phospholipid phosphatase
MAMRWGAWDWRIMSAVAEHRTHVFNVLTYHVMEVGTSPVVLALAAAACGLVVVWRRWYRAGIAAAASFVAAQAAATLLKPMFDRARPPAHLALTPVSSPSFPSTHASTTAAIAIAVLVATAWGTRRRALVATALLGGAVLFVNACMVYLGAHWVSDVLAGWILGGAIGAVIGLCARPRSPGPSASAGRATLEHA